MANPFLNFKFGTFNKLIGELKSSEDVLKNLSNGDVCFATYGPTNIIEPPSTDNPEGSLEQNSVAGSLYIKMNNKLLPVFAPPGELGVPLVGQGLEAKPDYSLNLKMSEINFLHENKDVGNTSFISPQILVSEEGTKSTPQDGCIILTLGNNKFTTLSDKDGYQGILRLYGQEKDGATSKGYVNIQAGQTSTITNFFLPAINGNCQAMCKDLTTQYNKLYFYNQNTSLEKFIPSNHYITSSQLGVNCSTWDNALSWYSFIVNGSSMFQDSIIVKGEADLRYNLWVQDVEETGTMCNMYFPMYDGTLSSDLWIDHTSITLSNMQEGANCGMMLAGGNSYMYASQGAEQSAIDIYPKKISLINRNNTIEVTDEQISLNDIVHITNDKFIVSNSLYGLFDEELPADAEEGQIYFKLIS